MTLLVPEILRKKRDGGRLTPEEISFLVRGFANGTIPDYQASAWLMASFIKGLDETETVELTRNMKDSGRVLKWRELSENFRDASFADKHSTGGVGDKVSLVLAPVAACLGVKVPMMSGRGLGHTGGTADKLQSISGFDIYPTTDKMVRLLDEVGVCMMAQAPDLCPADRKLYSLRDVTGTIESVPLITASIVSKKWAEGVDAIVFDVKVGDAAFMSDAEQARALSRSLCRVAELAGIKARACLTRMEEPLGVLVGNTLEVEESLWILADAYPTAEHRRLSAPLREISIRLAAEMAWLAGRAPSLEAAIAEGERALKSGRALGIFERMVRAQGGAPDWREKIHVRAKKFTYPAIKDGYVSRIHSREIGLAGLHFGVGRRTVDDKLAPKAGFELAVAVGDHVRRGQPLLHYYTDEDGVPALIRPHLDRTFEFSDKAVEALKPLLMERIPE